MGEAKKPSVLHLPNGDTYTATVGQVLERDQVGRPTVCRFMMPGESIDLREASGDGTHTPEFLVVYANQQTWGKPSG